ncbi:hypothetical protein Gotur_024122, partial [Gossypium turneri]
MAHGNPFTFQGQYMLIQRDAQPDSSRWQPRNPQPRSNRVPPFAAKLGAKNEASDSSLQFIDPDPLHEVPPSFEDFFGYNLHRQHPTRSGSSSSYHPDLHPEVRTPTTEDLFPSAPPVMQYQLSPDYGEHNYSTFLTIPE